MEKNLLWIQKGLIIDPANNREEIGDLFVKDGKIVASLSQEEKSHATKISAENLVVCPGLIDIHVHLRFPGQTHKETIKSASQAAAAGGITTLVCMPNTSPPIDNTGTLQLVNDTIKRDSCVNIFTTSTITVNLQGQQLAPIGSLKELGIVAITDDGCCVQNNELMRRAAEYASMFNLPLMDHCQDTSLTQKAVMNEGEVSLRLGLQGWPNAAEDIIVARNIILSHYTKAHIHMQHITSAYAVELIRNAKNKGIQVTAEATPHHISLTENNLASYNTLCKMNPPLRTEQDRLALIDGLIDGTIDVLATDHAPHTNYEKNVEFDHAPFGIIGLQTLLPISLSTLVHSSKTSLPHFISLITHKPATLLNLNKGTLSPGADADITLFHPTQTWILSKENIFSRSYNTPWLNQKLTGKVHSTFVSGKLVYSSS